MKITTDWHIHTQNSCDGACMVMSDLISEAAKKGITDFGVTDHIHTSYNLPDVVKSRDEYLANNPSTRFHFGVEASVMSQWEIDEVATNKYDKPVYGLRKGGPPEAALAIGITDEECARYGIEYIVGGTHWPMYVPFEREAVIRDYHRQNMYLATHPLVDIVAHPWWWMGHWADEDGNFPGDPWLGDFTVIPKSMHQEFAAAAIENDTAVEINISANLLNKRYPEGFAARYLEYIADLQSQGVKLSIGGDCHSSHYDVAFEKASEMIEAAGIKDDFWCLGERE